MSPRYPQANGKAENSVGIVKRLMRKAAADGRNPFLALLAMRNTPPEGIKYSPAQRIFGRSTRTNLPVTVDSRRPCSILTQVTSERLTESQTRENVLRPAC